MTIQIHRPRTRNPKYGGVVMKYLVCLVLSLVMFWITSTAWGGDKEEVATAMQKWAEAFQADSPDPILALYDKEAVLWGTTSRTPMDDPAAIRGYFAKGISAFPIHKVTFKDPLIRIYGNIAINTGYYTFSLVIKGETKTFPARYSFTYVKRGDRWLIVDHHSSAMPKPRPAKK